MRVPHALLAAAILLSGSPPAAAAASHTVEIFSNYFTPDRVDIQSGDTVHWLARNGGHAVQADDGRFRFPPSGTFGSGDSASYTFSSNNEWVRFRCAVHSEMRGVIKIGTPPPAGTGPPPVIRSVPSDAYPTIDAALTDIPANAAIDLAPGIYDASVLLDVPGVHLRGTGASPDDVVLRGQGIRGTGVTGRAAGTGVENLTLDGFTVAGVAMTNADGFVVAGVRIAGVPAVNGITIEQVRGGRVSDATIDRADRAGILIEDCDPCDMIVERSVVRGATVGLHARGAGSLVVRNSRFEGNVTGLAITGTAADGGGAHLFANTFRNNVLPYARPGGLTDLAPNAGIWLDGAHFARVEGNDLDGHRYGVAVTGAGAPSLANTIVSNRITSSSVAGFAWDGIGEGVCFAGNIDQNGETPSGDPPMASMLYPCNRPTPGVPLPTITARVFGLVP